MDLIQWRNLKGQEAVVQLFERAGYSSQYLYHVMNGFKPIGLGRALILAKLQPDLDALALVRQHERILALKLKRGKKWREDGVRKKRKTTAALAEPSAA